MSIDATVENAMITFVVFYTAAATEICIATFLEPLNSPLLTVPLSN